MKLAAALRAETGVSYLTSRQHLAKACRRERYEASRPGGQETETP